MCRFSKSISTESPQASACPFWKPASNSAMAIVTWLSAAMTGKPRASVGFVCTRRFLPNRRAARHAQIPGRRRARPCRLCAQWIRESSERPAQDLLHLFRWQIFNWLAGNSNDHAKNLALVQVERNASRWHLASFYDLVFTRAWPDLDRRLAMNIGGEADPGRRWRLAECSISSQASRDPAHPRSPAANAHRHLRIRWAGRQPSRRESEPSIRIEQYFPGCVLPGNPP